MRSTKQGTARGIFSAFLVVGAFVTLGGCAGDPRCLPAAPDDPTAYRAAIEANRGSRERSFRDPANSPVPAADLADWEGLEFYEVDPAYRLEGKLVRHARAIPVEIPDTEGGLRQAEELGYFLLDLGAGEERLPVFRMQESGHWFLPFLDATSEIETYPAGRYLEIEDLGSGRFRLDFNRAYNPYCAYGGDWSCPMTPESNRLKAAVRAGEKGYRYLEH